MNLLACTDSKYWMLSFSFGGIAMFSFGAINSWSCHIVLDTWKPLGGSELLLGWCIMNKNPSYSLSSEWDMLPQVSLFYSYLVFFRKCWAYAKHSIGLSNLMLTLSSVVAHSSVCDHACRIVSLPANLDFMIFNHRGRALPSDPDLKLKK